MFIFFLRLSSIYCWLNYFGLFGSHTLSLTHTIFSVSSLDLAPGLSFAPDAFEALRCAAEDHLSCMFKEAVLYAVHSQRKAIEVSDIMIAKHIGEQHRRFARK